MCCVALDVRGHLQRTFVAHFLYAPISPHSEPKPRHPTFSTLALPMKTAYADITPFITKDGSLIRELMHPTKHAVREQSFAEAEVMPGATTQRHLHLTSEEIYHITAGNGLMELGEEKFSVTVGDTIVIPPGTVHRISNIGSAALKIICACSPAYSDADTVLR
jgi:mannose-6-phosphate isomerase-like protein (cupin superfamily)